jgi:hypothetical protein
MTKIMILNYLEGDACRSRNMKNGFDKQNPPRPERAENQMDAICN